MPPPFLARFRDAVANATDVRLDDDKWLWLPSDDPLDPVRGGAVVCVVVSATHSSVAAADVEVVWEPGVVDDHRAALCVRGEVYRRDPHLFEELAVMGIGALSRRDMALLNRAVTVDHHTPAAVARRYLGDLRDSDG